MRASAIALSNNILKRGRADNVRITPMKLQKLLYYVCVKYAKETGELPIYERFDVWKYGPVLTSIYAEFKPYGSSAITSFATNAKGRAVAVDESVNPLLKKCLDYVWKKLGRYSAIELSERTHRKGSGWYAAYQEDRPFIEKEDMINDTSL